MKSKKQCACKDGTIIKEDLPYPLVHYPGFYGAFFAFREMDKSQLTLCLCSKKAIENYISLRTSEQIGKFSDPTRMFILDSMYFPIDLTKELMLKNVPNNKH